MPPNALQLQLPLPQPQPGSERQETLADRLCDLLIRRGRPLEVGHVVAQVLRVKRCPEVLQRRLVAEIVDADQRLAWRGRDLVGLAPPGWVTTKVRDATYCVVDLETTGGVPGRAKITEIGAVRVSGGRIVDRFTTLVDPGHPIPAPIMRITGIRDEMLVGQPRIEEALGRFVDFVRDDVMVAHNAPFDLRFLNYERFRISGRYFTQPWLDTLTIARRLLKHRVERFDLGSLAVWADTIARPNHRALPDAEATGELLIKMLDMLVDRGIGTLERAVAFGQTGGSRFAHKLALAEDLPQEPGIYLMRDRSGAVLYVGKARNLRRRVRSYFGPQGKHGRLIGRALEAVARIDHEPSASELTALLREASLIREHRPPCNTRGVRAATRYLKLTVHDAEPRLFVVADVLNDGAAYFGPIRSDRTARLAVASLHALYPLATRGRSTRAGQQALMDHHDDPPVDGDAVAAAEEVHALLSADRAGASALLLQRFATQARAVGAVATPEGREAYEALLAVIATLARVRAASTACGVITEHAPSAVHATFIAGGRVVGTLDLGSAAHDDIAGLVAEMRRADAAADTPLVGGELDEAVILHDWLRGRVDQPGVIALARGFAPDHVVAAVGRVRDAVTPPAIDELPDAA